MHIFDIMLWVGKKTKEMTWSQQTAHKSYFTKPKILPLLKFTHQQNLIVLFNFTLPFISKE